MKRQIRGSLGAVLAALLLPALCAGVRAEEVVTYLPTPVPVEFREPPTPTPVPKAPATLTPETVRAVQTALSQAGYKCRVDGIYGNETATAIRSFQQVNQLDVDGEITYELMEALGVLEKPFTPSPVKAPRESWQRAQFEEDLFAGTWYRLWAPRPLEAPTADYQIYLPGWWTVRGGYAGEDAYELLFEQETEEGFSGFEMASIRLIQPGASADAAMEALEETALFYDGFAFPNTTAADCRVADFLGMMLYAWEEEGRPAGMTCTFAGQNPEGQVLIAGFSYAPRRRLLRRQMENLLCSVQRARPLSYRTDPDCR